MGGPVVLLFRARPRLAALRHEVREAVMCFVHSGSAEGGSLIQQTALGAAAATAFSTLAAGGGAVGGMAHAASRPPDVVARPGGARGPGASGPSPHTPLDRDPAPCGTRLPRQMVQLPWPGTAA